jgi:8-oxo-dGTP pyrophosphatase MutT (NUDIX family)
MLSVKVFLWHPAYMSDLAEQPDSGADNGKQMKSRHFVTDSTGPSTQVAALCWRKHRSQIEVLLITSRDTGRWVLPKGWTMKGLTGPEAAAIEAWEEAGVEGKVSAEALGFFGYDKVISPDLTHPCMVSVFPLRVATLSRRFPERPPKGAGLIFPGISIHTINRNPGEE